MGGVAGFRAMSEVFVFLARASAAKLPRSMRGAMRGKIAATVRGALCGVLRGKTAALGAGCGARQNCRARAGGYVNIYLGGV